MTSIYDKIETPKDLLAEVLVHGFSTRQEDIGWHCNRLDTHIWFRQHGNVYQTYLPDDIKAVEESMGFVFSRMSHGTYPEIILNLEVLR